MSLVQHAAIHNYPRTDYQIGRMLLSEAVEVGSNVLLLKGVGLDALSQVIVSLHLQKTCWRISAGPPPPAPRTYGRVHAIPSTHHKQCALPR